MQTVLPAVRMPLEPVGADTVKIPELDGLLKAIDGGESVPVVLVSGGDDAVVKAVVALLAKDLGRTASPVGVERLDAEPARTEAWGRLVEVASAVPMFGEGTILVITGCGKGEKVPAELKSLLASWPPHVRVALFANRKTESTPLGKAVKAVGQVVSLADLKDRAAEGLAEQAARDQQITLGPGVSRLLIDLVGVDRGAIESAVKVLAGYLGPGGRATDSDLQGLVQRSRKSNPWDLDEAISSRDLARALKIAVRDVEDAKDGKTQAMRILYGVLRHARKMLVTKDLVAQRIDAKVAMKRVGVNWPFMWERLRDGAARYSQPELEAFLAAAVDSDLRFKRGHTRPAVLVTDLLTRLIGVPRRR